MQDRTGNRLAAALGVLLLGATMAQGGNNETAAATAHGHSHDHAQDNEARIAKGHFNDEQIQPRSLSDWEGTWQSVFPLLLDGTLDPVMAHKAAHGDKTAAEYRDYYETGYRTDVGQITIRGDEVSFRRDHGTATGRYVSDGFEVLTYKKGNRGVRYVFKKVAGDAAAPAFIQFSDHAMAPVKAGHYHLYWGADRAALLNELTNWPTYYPASLDRAGILAEMLAH